MSKFLHISYWNYFVEITNENHEDRKLLKTGKDAQMSPKICLCPLTADKIFLNINYNNEQKFE
jgi:hypothetical protein